jgi:hypothetical protein
MLKVGRTLRDIWIYFKTGHSGYLTFVLSIMHFVVLQHRLLISYIPFLSKYLGQLSTFALFFFVTYIPVAVVVGYYEFQKGYIKRRPQLNPYIQDTVTAQMLQTQGLLSFTNGDTDKALNQLEGSLEYLRRWKKS